MQNHTNGRMPVKGSLDAIHFWAEQIIALHGAKLKEDLDNTESALRTLTYEIPIMGNPKTGSKSVTMKVIEDAREGTAELKIEAGSEYLIWQAKTPSLCLCCYWLDWFGEMMVCNKLKPHPSRHKRVCDGYKYKEKKGA